MLHLCFVLNISDDDDDETRVQLELNSFCRIELCKTLLRSRVLFCFSCAGETWSSYYGNVCDNRRLPGHYGWVSSGGPGFSACRTAEVSEFEQGQNLETFDDRGCLRETHTRRNTLSGGSPFS